MRGPRLPLVVLRLLVALLLGIHGWFRLLTGGPVPFGQWLSSQGLPFGEGIAWAITIFECAASLLLATGKGVRWAAAGHLFILGMGIAMVHGPEGWFVVGGGRNGAEYSVLLMGCLVVLLLDERERARESA